MRSGFVAILGRANVGKSTLLNALVGSKVSIVASKPQTTRNAIQGVLTTEQGQVIFVDSPGVHKPSLELGRRMMSEVRRATEGCHAVLLVIDSRQPLRESDHEALRIVGSLAVPSILVLNKIDLVANKNDLLPRMEEMRQLHNFEEMVPVSALRGDGLDVLRDLIYSKLPELPAFYPEDFITDQPERFLAAELIREQIVRQTEQEVPHSVAVLIDKWEDLPRLLRLSATVFVERAGQKAILIGRGGERLKEIGTKARLEIEARFGKKVFLEIFVKVQPKWRDKAWFVRELDWRRFLSGTGSGEFGGSGDSGVEEPLIL